jgi:hypothetical protein
MVLFKALKHSNQFTQWLSEHWGLCRGSETAPNLKKPPVNNLCGQDAQTVLTLKMTL